MAKQALVDRAISELEEKKAAIRLRCEAESAALDSAITALRNLRPRRPRVVKAVAEKVG